MSSAGRFRPQRWGGRIASSSASRARNGRARASLLLGLVGAASLPVTIAIAELTNAFELVRAAFAIPVAFVLGIVALVLARGARTRIERTLGRVGGEGAARAGRLLGLLAILLGIAGGIALAFYYVLQTYE